MGSVQEARRHGVIECLIVVQSLWIFTWRF